MSSYIDTPIANEDELIKELTEMLKQFDKDMNSYQTDVYLYYDETTQTATLDTFVNVGGNSWLADDHYTIYCDKEHYDDWGDYYQDEGYIADVLDISLEQLHTETKRYHNYDDEDIADPEIEPVYSEIEEYTNSRDDYSEKLLKDYYDYIDGLESEYAQKAEEIIERFKYDRSESLIEEQERKERGF